ncbi:hypothetical protein DSO57_1009500 [Entomophthora muscae]|uniref:Uncharacterized protein n=1 Tax=Entomophthora muscae TaxID=34485 RepID=A0ACC2US08_9FUNG|nr:hypothetical protein DSO57_1009500 [Entomophthora muscae]
MDLLQFKDNGERNVVQSYEDTVKHINDPIHGYIQLDASVLEFIDTRQFQRLRGLHQMGTAYLVFPGASHRRFEHSIGVSHLAGTLLKKISASQPELDINSKDIRCVELAGLCHDLGHGPFSHLFDHGFIQKVYPGEKWTHEQGSNMMLDYLIDDNNIDIEEDSIRLIKSLILGERPEITQFREKGFLFDIVANQRNSVDVDKFDYIQRDCHNIGIKSSYDTNRLMTFCRVIDNQLCYNQKEVYNLYEMFHTRYSLFKRIYCHRVARALDLMVCEVLLLAQPVMKLAEKIHDAGEYLYLNDSILDEIARSKTEYGTHLQKELKAARELLKRIHKRDLYKFVDQVLIPKEFKDKINQVKITESFISSHQSDGHVKLRPEDLALDWTKLNYGKEDRNPVDHVKFFSKYDTTSARHISKDMVSYLVPEQFSEMTLRVFAKDKTKIKAIQVAFRRALLPFGLSFDDIFTYPSQPPSKKPRVSEALPRFNSSI